MLTKIFIFENLNNITYFKKITLFFIKKLKIRLYNLLKKKIFSNFNQNYLFIFIYI